MQGVFHEWHDFMLMNVISKKERLYQQDLFSDGILKSAADETLICRINDFEDLGWKCREYQGDIAAIILDPYMATFGCMRMQAVYVEAVRKLCDKEGILLIFDEVVTGMRIGLDGASGRFAEVMAVRGEPVQPQTVCEHSYRSHSYLKQHTIN